MRLTEDVFLVGSWQKGLSGGNDCEVYALETGGEVVLVDAGAGREPGRIVANLEQDGLDPHRVSVLLLTHEHSDHACGAAYFRERFGTRVMCHQAARALVERGSEAELGLDVARAEGVFPPDFRYRHCPVDRALADPDKYFGEIKKTGEETFKDLSNAMSGWATIFAGISPISFPKIRISECFS